MSDRDFEGHFQDLVLVQGVEAGIDQFAEGYALLLGAVREEMGRGRTLGDILQAKECFGRLKSLLLTQVVFVGGLKDKAMVDEFETIGQDLPAIVA